MKKQPRKNSFFGTVEYWRTTAIAVVVSIILIIPAVKIIPSAIKYQSTNAQITDVENIGNQFGWTDKRHDKVEELKAKQAKMAEKDEVFDWCYSARNNKFAACMRNVSILVVAILFICGVLGLVYVLSILIRDTKGYIAYRLYTCDTQKAKMN